MGIPPRRNSPPLCPHALVLWVGHSKWGILDYEKQKKKKNSVEGVGALGQGGGLGLGGVGVGEWRWWSSVDRSIDRLGCRWPDFRRPAGMQPLQEVGPGEKIKIRGIFFFYLCILVTRFINLVTRFSSNYYIIITKGNLGIKY